MRKLIMAAAALLAIAGCAGKRSAEEAVAQFHQMLDAGRYQEIYQNSDPELKRITSEEQLTALLTQVHERLGAVRSSSQSGFNLNTNNGISRVELTYNTEFTGGRATENFNYRVEGTQARLVGYHINSNDLAGAPPPSSGK
jgi:opacity protein-like surface antigen